MPRVQTRAKAIRKYVDKMIQLAKVGTLHARRQARRLALPYALVVGTELLHISFDADADGGVKTTAALQHSNYTSDMRASQAPLTRLLNMYVS